MDEDSLSDLDFLPKEDVDSLREFFNGAHKAFLDRVQMTEEEYARLCAPYAERVSAFTDKRKAEKSKRQQLETALRANAVRVEKSRGGEGIHRGYYCPSLIYDIVVGNCKRGNLCRENNPNARYTHYFDDDNNHIATVWHNEDGAPIITEYILHRGNNSVGFSFDNDGRLQTMAECEYDERGRILAYVLVEFHHFRDEVTEYYEERYRYSEESVVVETASLFVGVSPALLNLNRYVFQTEAGFLKNYTVELFDCVDLRDQPLDGRFYDVKIKRKIPM